VRRCGCRSGATAGSSRAAIRTPPKATARSAKDAYALCSLAGDLKVLEIVDAGVWNVGFTMPLEVFDDAGRR
jgi:acetamidase/formamidase